MSGTLRTCKNLPKFRHDLRRCPVLTISILCLQSLKLTDTFLASLDNPLGKQTEECDAKIIVDYACGDGCGC